MNYVRFVAVRQHTRLRSYFIDFVGKDISDLFSHSTEIVVTIDDYDDASEDSVRHDPDIEFRREKIYEALSSGLSETIVRVSLERHAYGSRDAKCRQEDDMQCKSTICFDTSSMI